MGHGLDGLDLFVDGFDFGVEVWVVHGGLEVDVGVQGVEGEGGGLVVDEGVDDGVDFQVGHRFHGLKALPEDLHHELVGEGLEVAAWELGGHVVIEVSGDGVLHLGK